MADTHSTEHQTLPVSSKTAIRRGPNEREYATGVVIESDSAGCTFYRGIPGGLISCGLVQRSWLPGAAGAGKTSQSVVLLADGTGRLLPSKSRAISFDEGFGVLSIWKSGGLYRIRKSYSGLELDRRRAAENVQEEQEVWKQAKKVHVEFDYVELWRRDVTLRVDEIEHLMEGSLVFSEYPEIGLSDSGIRSAKKALAELRNVLQWSAPRIKDVVQNSNVVSPAASRLQAYAK